MKSLAIIFVWDKNDNSIVQKYIQHSTELLTRNTDNPFSRNLDLPIFYFSNAVGEEIPSNIDICAEKVIVCLFVGKKMVISDKWDEYIETLYNKYVVIPIALDKSSFNIESISKANFIREYEYVDNKEQQLFISLAHEIYRFGFNYKSNAISTESALKIFLSHTKEGENGKRLALQLKNVIDNSSLKSFFDVSDIGAGYRFDEEILNNIKCSSIIVINSDLYSTRYWCQLEVSASKENDRPIIEVDLVKKGMDRKYPYAGNIPVVRVETKNNKVNEYDIYRILEAILVESIRYCYINNKLSRLQNQLDGKSLKMSRPPEMFDLKKIIFREGNSIKYNYNTIIYPDPPIYSEELEFFENMGIKTITPVGMHSYMLSKKNIGISISNPEKEQLMKIGQTEKHLKKLSQLLAKYLLCSSATLVYGGDLRKDGFTENLILEAKILRDRFKSSNIHLKNYLSWPIYLKDSDEVIDWKAKNKKVLSMESVEIDESVIHLIDSESKFIFPNTLNNRFVWSKSLTKMREKMIEDCDIRICAGGSTKGYKGKMPGVLEEILIANKKSIPIYLLGGFGGVVHSVCEVIENDYVPENLTLEWQIENNPGYSELLNLYKDKCEEVDYSEIIKKIKCLNLNNGLSDEDNKILFSTAYAEEAVYLILKGLKALKGKE